MINIKHVKGKLDYDGQQPFDLQLDYGQSQTKHGSVEHLHQNLSFPKLETVV